MSRRAIFGALALSALVVTAGGAAVAARVNESAITAQLKEPVQPGPDSTRVAMMLNTLRSGDQLICELVVDRLRNNWWGNGDDGVGRFADDRRAYDAVQDSLRGHVTSAGAIELLMRSMNEEDPCVRRAAAHLLGRSKVEPARLAKALQDPSPRVRAAVALAIGVGNNEHGAAARSSLEQLLRDGGANDAAMAAWALGEIEDTASVPALTRALRSTHTPVRLAAVGALGNIESDQARPEIERLLRDDADVAVRAHAAHALGDIGSASSVRALSQALRDPAPRVQYAAVEAIENLHDIETAPAELIAATRSSDAKLQRLAAMALAEIHDPQTLDALLALVTHADREVRLHIAEALGEIGSAKASAGLMTLLRDSDPEVRRAAAEALGEIRE